MCLSLVSWVSKQRRPFERHFCSNYVDLKTALNAQSRRRWGGLKGKWGLYSIMNMQKYTFRLFLLIGPCMGRTSQSTSFRQCLHLHFKSLSLICTNVEKVLLKHLNGFPNDFYKSGKNYPSVTHKCAIGCKWNWMQMKLILHSCVNSIIEHQ